MRITMETPGGRLIDIVDDVSEVINQWYILKVDVPKINTILDMKQPRQSRVGITREIAKELEDFGYLKKHAC